MKGLVDVYFMVFIHIGSRQIWISALAEGWYNKHRGHSERDHLPPLRDEVSFPLKPFSKESRVSHRQHQTFSSPGLPPAGRKASSRRELRYSGKRSWSCDRCSAAGKSAWIGLRRGTNTNASIVDFTSFGLSERSTAMKPLTANHFLQQCLQAVVVVGSSHKDVFYDQGVGGRKLLS